MIHYVKNFVKIFFDDFLVIFKIIYKKNKKVFCNLTYKTRFN